MEPDDIKNEEVQEDVVDTKAEETTAPEPKKEKKEKKAKIDTEKIKAEKAGKGIDTDDEDPKTFKGYRNKKGQYISPSRARNMRLDKRNVRPN